VHLTGLDLLFWAAGFVENLGLLFVLWYRRRARAFPFFTTLATLVVSKTVILYFVRLYGTENDYAYAYWSLGILDMTLQLCVVYEVASLVFRPLNVWAEDVRSSFVWLISLSLLVALGLTWLESVPSPTWMRALTAKGNLFASLLLSELFVAMMAGRVFVDKCVDRHWTQLLRYRPGTTSICCDIPCSHGCLPGLRYLLDRQPMAR
jgi:hypothetical protein